jgi:hypothetical protein
MEGLRKAVGTSVKFSGGPAKIRTMNLLNSSLGRYNYTCLLVKKY